MVEQLLGLFSVDGRSSASSPWKVVLGMLCWTVGSRGTWWRSQGLSIGWGCIGWGCDLEVRVVTFIFYVVPDERGPGHISGIPQLADADRHF